MLQLSDFAAQKQAEVIAELVANGFFRIYSGEQPPLNLRTDGRLVDCKIVSAVANGATVTIKWESAVATKEGQADYYRIVTEKNIPVLSGSIPDQMEMSDRELKVGTVVDAGMLLHSVFRNT